MDKKEMCNCTACKENKYSQWEKCPHHYGEFRRLPKELGGLGLCLNLREE